MTCDTVGWAYVQLQETKHLLYNPFDPIKPITFEPCGMLGQDFSKA